MNRQQKMINVIDSKIYLLDEWFSHNDKLQNLKNRLVSKQDISYLPNEKLYPQLSNFDKKYKKIYARIESSIKQEEFTINFINSKLNSLEVLDTKLKNGVDI